MMKLNRRPIKVLHVGADNIGYGGRSVVAFNLTQCMDHEHITNDFLVFAEVKQKKHINALTNKGGKYVRIDLNGYHPKILREVQRTMQIKRIIQEEQYDIIHIHADNAYEAMRSIWSGQLAGIKKFVIHAHTTGSEKQFNIIKRIIILLCQRMLSKARYFQLACSDEAADYLFGSKTENKTVVIKDGIDTGKFVYNTNTRRRVRDGLRYAKDQLIVGCIGRFSPPKNYFFTLKIFAELLKKDPTARLMLVGDGRLKRQVEECAKEIQIYKSIDFLGNRNDVPDLLMAMDVFLLPSLYEGFGIVNLEAQCSGLPCIVSTEVPEMVRVTDLVKFVPLSESPEMWADTVCNGTNVDSRQSKENELIQAGYDITSSSARLQELYEKMGQI
jgi:glycosyltransferase involved in cell wall biosynthesis